jgi:predicted permease
VRFWNKVRARFSRAAEPDLAEEMRFHRQMIEDSLRAQGLSAAEARQRAALEFGPLAIAQEDSRAEWTYAWLESFGADVRHALRTLARDRTFAATAVLTLAAGLALATAAFALFNAYVLRPFAVADPASLYEVRWLGKDRWVGMHTWRDYEDIRARKDIFSAVLASRGVFVMGVDRHWQGKLVSGNYFRMLGAHMALGRPIEERDAQTPLGGHVIVISHGAWKSVFQLDPGVLGKKVALRGRSFEIIGVAASEFAGLDGSPPGFWAPITMHGAFRKEELAVEVIGRLRDGVTRPQAEAALGALASRGRTDMRAGLNSRATVVAFSPMMIFIFAPVVLALALVLATCCANVANILLARGLSRQREIGVRLSLGAGRARLVRQLLTEACVIATAAAALGLLLAHLLLIGGQAVFFATAAPEFARLVRLHSLELDYRVFLFALGAALIAAVGAALTPALQAARRDTSLAMRGEFSASFPSSRLRDTLVVMQVVACAVLLVCGALLFRRAAVFQSVDTGIDARGVVNVSAGEQGAVLSAAMRARPDVESVAGASRAIWFGRLQQTMVIPSGQANPRVSGYHRVSPDYFRLFHIRLRSGRGFTEEEARSGAPVAIVSEATARAYWPGEDPIGKTIVPSPVRERHLDALPGTATLQVIGVAVDVIQGWVFEGRDRACLYLPLDESKAGQLFVRFRTGENTAVHRLRQWISERLPDFEGDSISMSTVLDVQIYPFRAAAWIGWMLGLVAMALSVSGMYGVMSYLVNQRSKEIGIRVALGASPRGVVALVMRRSFWLAAAGVAVGAMLAGGAIKLLLWWSAEIGVLRWDGVALVSGAAAAGIVALLAALGPSLRAARVNPNTVLRAD